MMAHGKPADFAVITENNNEVAAAMHLVVFEHLGASSSPGRCAGH